MPSTTKFGHSGEPLFDTSLQSVIDLAAQYGDVRITITEDAHREGWSRVAVRVNAITVMERVVKFGHSGEPLFGTSLQSVIDLAAQYGAAPEKGHDAA